MGTIHWYDKVWFHAANILSFSNIRKQFDVHINTGHNDQFLCITVVKRGGLPMKFKEIIYGLYVYDVSNDLKNKDTKKNVYNYPSVSTTRSNENKFTAREIKNAKLAIDLHKKLGRPSYDHYMNMVEKNLIHDCPITVTDIKKALSLYGKDPATKKKELTIP